MPLPGSRYSCQRETTAIPASAFGSVSATPLNPGILTLATWNQNPSGGSGGLSMETNPPGSKELKKKLCQLSDMLLNAAT
jgi:hypothetical protein